MRFLERLNSPAVLVVAVTVFLVLDGFLFYRYQQSLRSIEGSASDTPVEEASYSPKAEPTAVQETTSSPQTEHTAVQETTSSLEEEPTAAEETTSSSEEEEDGVRVVVEVADTGVGLTILEDGLLVYDQVASSGFSEEFEAEEAITVTAADAGPVRVGVNGDDSEPLGASGEPVTRTFTAEA